MTTKHGQQWLLLWHLAAPPQSTARINSKAKTWLNSQPLPQCRVFLEKLIDTQLVNEFLTSFQHKYSQETTTFLCPLRDTSSPNLSDLFFKIHDLPSMPGSSKCYLALKLSNLNFVCIPDFL